MRVKEESEKAGLKFNIQKTKIIASGSITSWEIDEKQWKQCQTLFWGSSEITAVVIPAMKLKTFIHCNESYDHLESILKSRDITLPTKFRLVKAMVFPVVMYDWTVKKAVRVGLRRRLSPEELTLLNCGVGEDS